MLEKIIEIAKSKGPIKTAVVNPIDTLSLGGAIEAAKEGFIDPILIGNKNEINAVAKELNEDISSYTIEHLESEEEILQKMVELCKTDVAKIIMKGKIHTDHLMSAVVKRDNELRTTSQISHVFAVSIPTYHKILFITDCAINIAPTVEQKVKITDNAIDLSIKMGVANPKIAVLSATETPNPKMISSVDAEEVTKLLKEKHNNILVEGPMAFDNCISAEAAKIKGMSSEVAGDVDILVMPNIEAGNVTFKALNYLGNASSAGVVLGAKVPLILTSRADSAEARRLSAALACASI